MTKRNKMLRLYHYTYLKNLFGISVAGLDSVQARSAARYHDNGAACRLAHDARDH